MLPAKPKRLVLDANILIRATLGRRARHLIDSYAESVSFCTRISASPMPEEMLRPLQSSAVKTQQTDSSSSTNSSTRSKSSKVVFTSLTLPPPASASPPVTSKTGPSSPPPCSSTLPSGPKTLTSSAAASPPGPPLPSNSTSATPGLLSGKHARVPHPCSFIVWVGFDPPC